MTLDAVLRNDGSYVLRNDGFKILRNDQQILAVTPKTSISHVTIDAGEDLRRDHTRKKQILRLSLEIPILGICTKTTHILLECEGTSKVLSKLKVPLSLIQVNPEIHIKLEGPSYSTQKNVFSVIGEKNHEKSAIMALKEYKKLRKIDTLKEVLRSLDEE